METLVYPMKEYGFYTISKGEPVNVYDQSSKVL